MSMPIQHGVHRSNNNNVNNTINCVVASRNPLGALNNEDSMMNSDDYVDLKYHTGLSGNYNCPGLDELNLNKTERNGLNGSNNVDVNTFGNRRSHGSNRRAFSNVEFVQQKKLEQKQQAQKHNPPLQQQSNSKERKGLSGSHRWLTGLRSRSVSSPVVTGGEDKNRLFNGKEVNNQDNQQYWLRHKLKNKDKNAYLEKKYILQQQQLQDQKQKQDGFKAKRFFTTGAVGSNRYDYDEQDNDGKEEVEASKGSMYAVGNNNFVNLDPAEVKKEKKIRRWSVSSQYQQPLLLSQNGSTRGKPSIVSTPNTYFIDKETSNNNPTFKSDHILCFDRIPEHVGLNSIISQVSGGPLERILNVGAESSSNPRIVQLHFFQAADALAFYEYTTSGRFMINGTSYKPRWGHASLSVVYTFPKMVYDEMMYNGARRCIYLMFRRKSQVIPHRAIGNEDGGKGVEDVKHNADCTVSYMPCNGVGATGGSNWKPKAMVSSRNVGLDVSLETIQKDFGKFGQVLSVCPLISHHVNISIQYADVQDAIRAKKIFDRQSDEDIVKRYSQWTVMYGKDPTDRRVPVSL